MREGYVAPGSLRGGTARWYSGESHEWARAWLAREEVRINSQRRFDTTKQRTSQVQKNQTCSLRSIDCDM